MRKLMIAAALALGTASISGPAAAQLQTGGGLVNVQIGDVTLLNNFLNHDQIAALNNVAVPVSVQVPIGVAANVCGVNAAVLAKQSKTGAATCDAKSGSRALAQNVIKQKLSQTK